MRRLALSLALVSTSACASTRERVVVERVSGDDPVALARVESRSRDAGVTLSLETRDGERHAFPRGATILRVDGGLVVDPGPGRRLQAFAADDVRAYETTRFERVASRGLSTEATVAIGATAVISVILIAYAASEMSDSLDGIGNGLGDLGGLGAHF